MLTAEERTVLETARVGRLATADADGRPHVFPICFALIEPDDRPVLVTPVDEKPKAADPTELRRVRDIRSNGAVALVIDHYTEDWERLGWLQLRGTAAVLEPTDQRHATAVSALRDRYPQYADHRLEDRPVIEIRLGSVRSWGDLQAFTDR
ncbi:MAG: TIGR03668 family PPOX class F420-dependent oxidoreductase [Halobacteriales archaeon]